MTPPTVAPGLRERVAEIIFDTVEFVHPGESLGWGQAGGPDRFVCFQHADRVLALLGEQEPVAWGPRHRLWRTRQCFESIVVRVTEGDPRTDWKPVVERLAGEGLALLYDRPPVSAPPEDAVREAASLLDEACGIAVDRPEWPKLDEARRLLNCALHTEEPGGEESR